MLFDMLENNKLETKHYVILIVLGVVELVLFALMFYNCFLEFRQKRRQRKYRYGSVDKTKSDEEKAKPSLMEIFSVDMTLNRDREKDNQHAGTQTHAVLIPHRNNYFHHNFHNNAHREHRPSRNSL